MRVLIVSTNGLLRDGITSWLTQYFKVMDKTGIEPHTVAWEGTDGEVIEDVAAAGIIVHVIPSRKSRLPEYLHALKSLLLKTRFDVMHVCGNSGTIALELLLAKKVLWECVSRIPTTRCVNIVLRIKS